MATPDVRVRLSTEGVAEVVGALKKIQAEADKTSAKSSRGFFGLNSVLGSTTRLMGFLGIAVSAASFVNLIRDGVRAADALGKLGQKVGASVTNLSALNLVAKENDVEIEGLAQSMGLLNKRIAEGAEKNPQALATFKDLGIDPKDFKGKDAAEALDLVAKAFARLEPGPRKTKAAMDLFGRSGAQMIPLLNQLAEEGLGGVIERARELGVLIDDKTAAAVDRLSDGMDRLKLQAQVAGANFFAGFAGPVTESLSLISGEVSKSSDVWQSLGKTVGLTVEFIVGVVAVAVDAIFSLFRQGATVIRSSAVMLAEGVRGNWSAVAIEASIALATIEAESKSVDERMRARLEILKNLGKVREGPEPPPKRTGVDETDPTEALQRRATAAKDLLDRELKLVQLQAKLRNDAEKRAFDQGLISLQEFYRRRREIVIAQADAEVAALLKKRALAATEIEPAKRDAEVGKIDAELQTVRLERENELANLTVEETKAVRDLGRERLALEQKILEAQGQRHEAAMLAIEEEVQAEKERLGAAPGATEQVERLRVALTNVAAFDEVQTRAQAALEELAASRAAIQAQVDAGLLGQFSGEQKILELERERLALLQKLAAALLMAAQATGDPERIAQAEALSAAVGGLAISITAAGDSMAQFQAAFEGAALDALTNFFDQGITGAKSLKSAFLGAVASMADALRRLAAQKLAEGNFKALGAGLRGGEEIPAKAAGGEIGGGVLARVSAGEYRVPAAVTRRPGVLAHLQHLNREGARFPQTPAGRIRAAGYGLIRGPGSGVSDSILGRFEPHDFIVRAAVVSQRGVLEHLDEVVRGVRPLYQDLVPISMRDLRGLAIGGLVESAGAGMAVSSAGSNGGRDARAPREGRLQIGLDTGLIARFLESPEGQQIQLENMNKNRLASRHALGR